DDVPRTNFFDPLRKRAGWILWRPLAHTRQQPYPGDVNLSAAAQTAVAQPPLRVQHKMSDFHRVGVKAARQTPIDDRRAAEAGPNRWIDHIGAAARGADRQLAHRGGSGILLHPNGECSVETLLNAIAQRHVGPPLVDGVMHDPGRRADVAGAADADARDKA